MLAEFEPDGTVLLLRMSVDGTDVNKLRDEPLEGKLLRYYTQSPLGDRNVVLRRGKVADECGWEARWQPWSARYWTDAHTLSVTVDDKVYHALTEKGEYVMKPVWK